MPEAVCAEAADTRRLCCLLIYTPHLVIGPRKPTDLSGRSKYPITRRGELGRLFPRLQSCEQFAGNHHLLAGLR